MTTIEMIKNLAQRNSVVASADVLAVFAELEAKDAQTDIRIAEVEKRLKQRAEEMERILEGITPEMIAGGWTAKGISDYAKSLEAKLATPVRLPTEHELHQVSCSECAGNCLEMVETTIRAAGFKVEGDE